MMKQDKVDTINEILKEVLNRIKPSQELRNQKQNTANMLIRKIKNKFNYDAVVVGSLAKDTDINYDADIDIFVKFPVGFDKEEMGKRIVEIGKEFLTDYEIDYAEHPYIKGKFKNFSIELVPCYDFGEEIFDKFKDIATSVDRTIYHTKYVRERIKKANKLNDEIRVLKQFMKGCGVYGAEASVKGFSGYLAELLCIYYDSFINVVKNASEWKLNTFIDIENQWKGYGKVLFNDPLIVIDPVDKNRNVASALSKENMAKFIYTCRGFLSNPSIDFFFPSKKERDKEEIRKVMKERGTKFIAVCYEHPYMNINDLYPQLEKTRKALVRQIEKFKFRIMNSISWTNEKNKSIIIFEFEIFELPNVEIINGPPIDAPMIHQNAFLNKHKNAKLKGWRWIACDKRKFTNAKDCLKFLITQKRGFGKEFTNIDGKICCDEEILNDETKDAVGEILFL